MLIAEALAVTGNWLGGDRPVSNNSRQLGKLQFGLLIDGERMLLKA